ncbi:MAG: hypothetical protein ACXQTV_00900 [Candidatus Hecatellaceae archaeon]
MSIRAEKVSRLRVKSLRMEEYDWRGLVAVTITLGYIILLALRVPGVEMLGVAVGIVVGWYFTEKRRGGEGFKLARATEKHPDFKPIKAKLVEALQQVESYNPAYDDLLVNEIAKTVIDIRTVDRALEGAESLSQLHRAVQVKATLLRMLETCVEALAMTRRSRLQRGEVEAVKDSMLSRLQAILQPEET